MSSFLFLIDNDFYVKDGTLMVNIPGGYSFILFYSPDCGFCRNFIPIFKHLPDSMQGCLFGTINVGLYRNIIAKSRATNTPIKYVPLIMLYFRGQPIKDYTGPPDIESIKNFIITMARYVQETLVVQRGKQRRTFPPFVLGIPNTDDVSYLEFDEAYGN